MADWLFWVSCECALTRRFPLWVHPNLKPLVLPSRAPCTNLKIVVPLLLSVQSQVVLQGASLQAQTAHLMRMVPRMALATHQEGFARMAQCGGERQPCWTCPQG